MLFSHLQPCCFLKKKKSTRLRFSRTPLLNSSYLYRLNLSQWEFRSVLNLLKFLPCIYNYSFMGLLKIIAVYNILCIYARHSFTFPGRQWSSKTLASVRQANVWSTLFIYISWRKEVKERNCTETTPCLGKAIKKRNRQSKGYWWIFGSSTKYNILGKHHSK